MQGFMQDSGWRRLCPARRGRERRKAQKRDGDREANC